MENIISHKVNPVLSTRFIQRVVSIVCRAMDIAGSQNAEFQACARRKEVMPVSGSRKPFVFEFKSVKNRFETVKGPPPKQQAARGPRSGNGA